MSPPVEPSVPDAYSLLTRLRPIGPQSVIPPISEILGEYRDFHHDLDGKVIETDVRPYARRDRSPIPSVEAREGYHPDNDAAYWVMGLRDFLKVRQAVERHHRAKGDPFAILDIGCSTGRLLRHYEAHEPRIDVWGCDIDRLNVDFVVTHLPARINVFQNSIYPYLPFPEASFDVVTAFSVFTHIDTFEDTWLMEVRRILKPGGIAYITVHSERTWKRIPQIPSALSAMLKCQPFTPEWKIDEQLFESPPPADRLVFQFNSSGAYRFNTFHTIRYLERRWGRFLEVCAVYDGGLENYQDIAILRKN